MTIGSRGNDKLQYVFSCSVSHSVTGCSKCRRVNRGGIFLWFMSDIAVLCVVMLVIPLFTDCNFFIHIFIYMEFAIFFLKSQKPSQYV